ncbi:MAG: alpha/beta family hydrolase [Gemmatimonadota bacterium]
MSDLRIRRFLVSDRIGEVSAWILRPRSARALYVFAHGAGAGARHPFMEEMSLRLARAGVATFRFNFPYVEAGRRAPDRAPVLQATVRAAVAEAQNAVRHLPVLAGGKSMGGRMTSLAASEAPLPGVGGLAFFGFPLHPPGKESVERGLHLREVGLPMLFVQGDRDRLAQLDLLRPFLAGIRPRPTLHVVEGADHGFHVLKRSGRTDEEALDEVAAVAAEWMEDGIQK